MGLTVMWSEKMDYLRKANELLIKMVAHFRSRNYSQECLKHFIKEALTYMSLGNSIEVLTNRISSHWNKGISIPPEDILDIEII